MVIRCCPYNLRICSLLEDTDEEGDDNICMMEEYTINQKHEGEAFNPNLTMVVVVGYRTNL